MSVITLDTEQLNITKELLEITTQEEVLGQLKPNDILDSLKNAKKLYFQKFEIEDPTTDYPYDFSKDIPEELRSEVTKVLSERITKAGVTVPQNVNKYIMRIDGDPSLEILNDICEILVSGCKGAFSVVYSQENKAKKLLTIRVFWIIE